MPLNAKNKSVMPSQPSSNKVSNKNRLPKKVSKIAVSMNGQRFGAFCQRRAACSRIEEATKKIAPL